MAFSALIPQAFLTFDLLEFSKLTRQILNAQCLIRSLAYDDRTIKVKKLEQKFITTLSRNSSNYNESTTSVVPPKAHKMKRTLYIPDELWAQLDQYLKDHPEQNPSSVVQAALAEKLRPKNGSRLLSLAGIVENAPTDASVNEDYLIQE
ncbi:hypothetical protein [Nostoc sp. WHI]|uniref:hypothetical protein n=1 Tax=Nostoc sp. WHI TaxID=2650611 RepID=UPI001E57B294|nr:hypothetical protein [Nostoc sp. WHI]